MLFCLVLGLAAGCGDDTVEESFTISCPDNQNIVHCVWQPVDEFTIGGVDGKIFTDPNYQFTLGTKLVVCLEPEFVSMTTYFN